MFKIYLRLKNKYNSIVLIDDIMIEYSRIIAEISTFPANSDIKILAMTVDNFLQVTANRISILFTMYTNRNCHVSLKLYDPSHQMVRTYVRDQHSVRKRSSVDVALGWYPCTQNTAFKSILESGKKNYYCNNFLRASHFLRRYENINNHWRKLYSASLVVPITLCEQNEALDRASVWGFLTVDNCGGGFDSYRSVALLQSFARMYYTVLGDLSMVGAGTANLSAPSPTPVRN